MTVVLIAGVALLTALVMNVKNEADHANAPAAEEELCRERDLAVLKQYVH